MSGGHDFDLAELATIPDPLQRISTPPRAPATAAQELRERSKDVPSATRGQFQRRRTTALVVAVVWWVAVIVVSGIRADVTPSAALLLHVGLPALLGAAALATALSPGRLGLGPSFRLTVALAVLAPLLFVASSLLLPHNQVSAADLARGAFFCGDFALFLGAVPLVALAWAQRGSWVRGAGLRSTVLGLAVGLIAAASLGMHCANSDGVHVALGHGWPVLVLGAVGAFWIAKRTRVA